MIQYNVHDYCRTNQIKYFNILTEACNEIAGPTSASLCPGSTALYEEMSQRWRAIGNTASDLTDLRFEPQTSRSRDDQLHARPTVQLLQHKRNQSAKERTVLRKLHKSKMSK